MPTAKKLTAVSVSKLRPPKSGRDHHFDSIVPGFCLRVTDKGAKSWCLFYRIHGRQRLLTMGRYPAIGLAEARNEARKAYHAARNGRDPAAEQKAAASEYRRRRKNTFEAVIEDYLVDIGHLRTHDRIERIFQKYTPDWMPQPLKEIKRRDVIELRDKVKRDHGGSMANYVLATVRAFFNWALDRDMIQYSPCHGVKRAVKPTPRERVLRDEEIRVVWQAAEELGYPFGAATKLLFATAQRLGEVSAMEWSEIDDKRDVWHLLGLRTKTGRAHDIPLNSIAREVLASVPRCHDKFVFHSGRGAYIKGWSKAHKRIYEISGLKDPWTMHDIRRTVLTTMREHLAVSIDVIGGVANHSPNTVTERHYAQRVGLLDKRDALERWATHLKIVLEG